MNHALVTNIKLTVVIAFLGAVYVYVTLDSLWWALFAYSSIGMVVFMIFTLISVYIDENDESKKP